MNKEIKNIVSSFLFAVLLLAGFFICLLTPDKQYSESERRELMQLPVLSKDTLLNGEFTSSFESYAKDQFPERENMRSIKAYFSQNILRKLENNGLFYKDGHISKVDNKENEVMQNHAAERFSFLYNTYLKNNRVFLSIVPDKNFILAKENDYSSLDYDRFIDNMKSKVDFMEYIDITDLLSLDDYYKTDTHWKQENIIDIAHRLSTAMGKKVTYNSYTENIVPTPFYGVYTGQYALPVEPDTIKYLTSPAIESAVVTYYDTGLPRTGEMYNIEKSKGRDPYEMFLSGTMPLVTLENPDKNNKNHLILFRDSFGSSIAPLFLDAYDKITVIDTRYVKSEFIGNLVDFEGADVLFLYSSTLLNNSLAIN